MPARSVSCATMLLAPLTSVTLAVQLPSACTKAVPIAVVPPLSNNDTVEPGAVASAVSLPSMARAAVAAAAGRAMIATVGAAVSSVSTTGVELPVMPARSVSWATMLLAPLTSVTLVVQLPSACTKAVPIGVVPPLSYSDTVEPGAVTSPLTVPAMVWVATLVAPPGVVIATVGAAVSSVSTTGVELPVMPARSVSWATMLLAPLTSVTLVVQLPSACTNAVPIAVVPPLSNNDTVEPGAVASPVTLPLMVCAAVAVAPARVVIATVGAAVSSVSTTGVELPVMPARSVSCATMLLAPLTSVTLAVQLPSACTKAVPIAVVPPLSNNDTVEPGAVASPVTLPLMVCAAVAVAPARVVIATVGAAVSSVSTTGVELPVMPARSVSWATMLLAPLTSVTLVVQLPSACTNAVPIAVVPPLSNNDTVEPGAVASPVTLPLMVCAAVAVAPARVVIATVGAAVSSVSTTGVELPVMPARS